MRKLIFGINLSIDGCCDHSRLTGDEDVHHYFTNLIREVDYLVYGRKTYELMVPFWPDFAKNHLGTSNAMSEFAQTFDAVNKIVFSQSLQQVEDKKTRIISSDLKEAIIRLKQEPGKDILTGGVSLPSQLIEMGLVDEFHVVMQPIVVGKGRRLLDDISLERFPVKLVESKAFPSGSVALRYLKQ